MFTDYEKEIAIQHAPRIASLIANNDDGKLYYKVFSNMVERLCPQASTTFNFKRNLDNNIEAELSEMLQCIINEVISNTHSVIYTTGEISKYFGVSITSVNNWIKDGRFVGIQKKELYKQARIPGNALFKLNNGEMVEVQEVIKDWEKENTLRQLGSEREEKMQILKEIMYFEEKYKGKYEDLIIEKEPMSEEMRNDFKEWAYWLKRFDA